MKVLKTILRILLPIAVIGGAYFGYLEIMKRAPKPRRRGHRSSILAVDAVRLKKQDYQVVLTSQGTVQAKTQSTLIPEVIGRIVKIAPAFREGGFFEKEDVLVEIDPRDYEVAVTLAESRLRQSELELERVKVSELTKSAFVTEAKALHSKAVFSLEEERISAVNREVEVTAAKADLSKAAAALKHAQIAAESRKTTITVAESTVSKSSLGVEQEKVSAKSRQAMVAAAMSKLAEAKSQLKEEEAKAKQAAEDWKSIGDGSKPSELALRLPQLNAARAAVAAAEAQLMQAELDVTLSGPQIKNAEAAVGAAEAQLMQAKNDVALSKPEIATAQAGVDAAGAKLQLKQQNLKLADPQIATAKVAVDAAAAQVKQRELDLGLVESQIETAQAIITAAKAELAQARLNLERTKIRAPYAGRVLRRFVDLGQTVSRATVLATIYGVDSAEVRLPVPSRQLDFLDLPYRYRGDAWEGEAKAPRAHLHATIGRQAFTWEGHIARAEGAFDVKSRQLFVVAEIENPYGKREGRPPLKVGQFVEAEISGRVLTDVIVSPRSSIREGNQVLLVTKETRLARKAKPDDPAAKAKDSGSFLVRRKIEILWGDQETVVVRGLENEEILCTTPVTFAGETLKVKATIKGEAAPEPSQKNRPASTPLADRE
ncbi:MAG: HlyD family efflux transporter periplasmic adaptor subunit [Planctomycetota bacterium]|nr:HlyD family efflux transporter periplasmic adaptor subunit [Planctomycetota bacterium]